MAKNQKSTAPYAIFKKWFEENKKNHSSLPKEIDVNGVKYAIRKACVEPMLDLAKAQNDKIGIKLLESASLSSVRGRAAVADGDDRSYTVQKNGSIVIPVGLIGVPAGGRVAVHFSNQKIVITKPKDKDEEKK